MPRSLYFLDAQSTVQVFQRAHHLQQDWFILELFPQRSDFPLDINEPLGQEYVSYSSVLEQIDLLSTSSSSRGVFRDFTVSVCENYLGEKNKSGSTPEPFASTSILIIRMSTIVPAEGVWVNTFGRVQMGFADSDAPPLPSTHLSVTFVVSTSDTPPSSQSTTEPAPSSVTAFSSTRPSHFTSVSGDGPNTSSSSSIDNNATADTLQDRLVCFKTTVV
ncbi:hypothetical protein K435DRAFT_858624 [Dendrothele bispora CBS 962.96]|uniref:Uncharacterized protein n=1 Tax=Dendrothele bispora (strain CBS 962.96) TaxID=1314807 RepID=A0A4S8M3W5_DENBC|nr:hypothetical protein K435DRAFT_858624 [Dendrothele bispora CBS 962.96]